MIPPFGENVHKILFKIFKLNLKPEIKQSGIVLKKLYRMVDLETNIETYTLIANGKSLKFENKEEFIQIFIRFIKSSIADLNKRNKELREQENEAVVDETAISIEDDIIAYCGNQQLKLLNKMREFRNLE